MTIASSSLKITVSDTEETRLNIYHHWDDFTMAYYTKEELQVPDKDLFVILGEEPNDE
jgi:hypothetical protein